MTQPPQRPEPAPQPPHPARQGSPALAPAPSSAAQPASPPSSSVRAATGSSRRPLVIVLAILVAGSLLLVLLAVGTVTYLVMNGDEQPEPGAAPTAPTYAAPRPMTEVRTDHYSFSYPRALEQQDVSDLLTSMEYAFEAQDATESTRLMVMDFPVQSSVEETCFDLAQDSQLTQVQSVQIDGRPADHYQSLREDPETGEPVVGDLWCATARDFSILAIVGFTTGPEAEAAGISEGQLIVDSWSWTDG